MNQRPSKHLAAETVGIVMLLAAVVGSVILGERLAAGNSAQALLRIRFLVPGQTNVMERTKILILCTGNSARSQMAEGLLRHLGGDSFDVISAGVSPTRVRDEAVHVMEEVGIDISEQFSKSVDRFVGEPFDYVITVCDNANEHCPVFPGGTKRIHWSFEDPAAIHGDEATRVNAFRKVRDQISEHLETFIQSVGSEGV